MKKVIQLLFTLSIIYFQLSTTSAQVGINPDNSEPDASAMLDVKSSNKGVLIPRMSSTDRQQILDPAVGLMVYDSTAQAFYYFNGMGWLELLSGAVTFLEDSDGDTKIQVEENADEDIIRFDVGGTEYMTLSNGILGFQNTNSSIYIGNNTGISVNDTASLNVFIGEGAGQNTTRGGNNVFLGASAGQSNTSGGLNILLGANAGRLNQGGGRNVLLGLNAGSGAVLHNKSNNVMIGDDAGAFNEQNGNVFLGSGAGQSNNGENNIFIGRSAGTLETGSDRLYIENSSSNMPLIYGEFDNDLVRINGDLEVTGSISTPDAIGDSDEDTKIQVEESADEDAIRFDVAGTEAMSIDNTGNVGIGTTPNNQLTVKMGELAANTFNINTGSSLAFFSSGGPSAWQSFTSTSNGTIDEIRFSGSFGASIPKTIRIYEGEGIGGQLLYEEVNANMLSGSNLDVPVNASVNIIENQKYTIEMTNRGGWSINGDDTYADGRADISDSQDYRLRVTITSNPDTLLFEVTDSSLQLGQYYIPNTDGTADQVLLTDGNGKVSWQSIIDMDGQTLSFDTNNNNLSISNGNSVDLSSIDTDTDDQTIDRLDLSGSTLIISLENDPVDNLLDLSSIDTDEQELSFNTSNNMLSITDGNSVDLSNIDTDNQTLSFNNSNNTLSIANGNSVDLSSINSVQSIIADSDNNTKIQVEEGTNDNLIRFDVANTEVAQFTKSVNSAFILRPNSDNIFIGRNLGTSNTGSGNVFIGEEAGRISTSAVSNVIIGSEAGRNLTTGDNNTFIGSNAGGSNLGNSNVFIGGSAAGSNTNGTNNVFIGNNAGQASSGSGNVFIGYRAGRFEAGSNRLYIDNGETTDPLIYGEFDNNFLRVNGSFNATGNATLNGTLDAGNTTVSNLKVGSSGSTISTILKASISRNVGSINGNNGRTETFSVTGAAIGGVVHVSPRASLGGQIVIAQAWVSSGNTVSVRFRNTDGGSQNPPDTIYDIVVIQ